jgi:hypothetical protein
MGSWIYIDNCSNRPDLRPDNGKDQQRCANGNQPNREQTPAHFLLAYSLPPFLAFTLLFGFH